MGRSIDERCDVYSLGVVTYVLLTGRLPFDVSDPMALVVRRATDRPPPLDDSSLDSLLARSMALDPGARPQTANDLADALAHLAAGGREAPLRQGWQARVVLPLAALIFVASATVTWLILR